MLLILHIGIYWTSTLAAEILPCKYNPFPIVLGDNAAPTTIRHLDYRADDHTLAAAGDFGGVSGMAIFQLSNSGDNLGLMEFKW